MAQCQPLAQCQLLAGSVQAGLAAVTADRQRDGDLRCPHRCR